MSERKFSIFEIISIVGILAGLLLVTWELQQNSDAVRAQTRSALSEQALSQIALGLDPDIVDLLLRSNSPESLSEIDKVRLSIFIRMQFRAAENSFYQHRMGTFDDEEFEGIRQFYINTFSNPNEKLWWSENKGEFSIEFQRELDESIFGVNDT